MTGKLVEQKVLEIINNKGWNLYQRGGTNAKISWEEMITKGPVKNCVEKICYDILPRVEKPKDQSVIRLFLKKLEIDSKIAYPEITLPREEFPYFGRQVIECRIDDAEEKKLFKEKLVSFTRIEFQGEEIILSITEGFLPPFIETTTFLPYGVFMKALNTLQDITSLISV